MVECLTREREAAGSSLTGVTALCPCTRHIYPSLVLVQPRKTRPYMTERLFIGRKESNQTNKLQNEVFLALHTHQPFITYSVAYCGLHIVQ